MLCRVGQGWWLADYSICIRARSARITIYIFLSVFLSARRRPEPSAVAVLRPITCDVAMIKIIHCMIRPYRCKSAQAKRRPRAGNARDTGRWEPSKPRLMIGTGRYGGIANDLTRTFASHTYSITTASFSQLTSVPHFLVALHTTGNRNNPFTII